MKNNFFKRILAVILSLALMTPLATVGVRAEESQSGTQTISEPEKVDAQKAREETPAMSGLDSDDCAAIVTIQGITGEQKFKTASEAWDFVNHNRNRNVTMTLYKDWVADENGNFGELPSLGFDNGSLAPLQRTKALTLNLNGYKIDRGLTSGNARGQVFVFSSNFNNSQMTIDGRPLSGTGELGRITGGNCTGNGGGILIQGYDIRLNLNDVVVTGNRSARNGGGIYCDRCNSILNITGETEIKGNTSGGQGGGMYLDRSNRVCMTVNLTGDIRVQSNTATDTACCDIALKKNAALNDVTGLTSGAKIGINKVESDTGVIAAMTFATREKAEDCAEYFTCSDPQHSIGVNAGMQLVIQNTAPRGDTLATVTVNGRTTKFDNIDLAWESANDRKYAGQNVIMTLYSDWAADKVIKPLARQNNSTMTIDLNQKTIRRSQSPQAERGALFDIVETGNYVIRNGNLTGGSNGAIWFRGDKTNPNLTLEDMEIFGNTTQNGGALYCDCNGTLNIRNSRIYGNTGTSEKSEEWKAGGIYVSGSGVKINLSGKVEIRDNNSDNKTQENLVLAYGARLADISALTAGSVIYVTLGNGSEGAFTVSDSSEKNPDYFKSGDILYQVEQKKQGENTCLVLSKSEHVHLWTYEAEGTATIKANCDGAGECRATDKTVTISKPDSLTFDGKAKPAKLSNPTLAGETVDIEYYMKTGETETPLNDAPIQAGKYVAKIRRNDVVASVEYTIAKKSLTLDAGGVTVKDKTYDATTRAEVTVDQDKVKGKVSGYGNVNVEGTGVFSDKNAGNRRLAVVTLTLTGGDAENYEMSGSSTIQKAAKISPSQLTVTGTTVADRDYNGTTTATITCGTVKEIFGEDRVTVTTSGTFPSAEAGTYDVNVSYTLTGEDKDNYKKPVDDTCTATIRPLAGQTVRYNSPVYVDNDPKKGLRGFEMKQVSKYEFVEESECEEGIILGKKGMTTWFVVKGKVEFSEQRIEIRGDVHLIILDGAMLDILGCITVCKDEGTLTIYSGTLTGEKISGTGAMRVTEPEKYKDFAAIGGRPGADSGAITINQCTVQAYGYVYEVKGEYEWIEYGCGAGIGGGSNGNGNNIILNDCKKVYSIGGSMGAGIGGGKCGTGNNIIINGGDVEGKGSGIWFQGAAGIGGGYNAGCDGIYINEYKPDGSNKDTIVTGKGGYTGAGIGGGGHYRYGGAAQWAKNIFINGGTVVATSGEIGQIFGGKGGAGIGSGREQCVENIVIRGGTVSAEGGSSGGAGIGCGEGGACKGVISILSGSNVTAFGGKDGGAGIGGGEDCSSGTIRISGPYTTVEATGGANAAGAGIGGGSGANGENITINGGATVTAIGGEDDGGAGIGGGKNGDGKNITIEGEQTYVEAIGGDGGAGIGGGRERSGFDIKIIDATVKATTGNNGAAGIGGGNKGEGYKITIENAYVTATGAAGEEIGGSGAGIGGGYQKAGFQIYILNNSVVTAYGGSADGGAGIGGGEEANGNNITISDSSVTAIGGMNAAGIGGGEHKSGSAGETGNGDTIKITDSNVIAKGTNNGAGIGGGYKGKGTNIHISKSYVEATGGMSKASGIGCGNWDDGWCSATFTKDCEITVEGKTYKNVTHLGNKELKQKQKVIVSSKFAPQFVEATWDI